MQVSELREILSELDDTMEVFIYGEGGYEGDTYAKDMDLTLEFVRFYGGKFSGTALVIS